MGLVRYALKFRVTFYVLAILIAVLGVGAVVVMPKDVLPNVDIPVVSVIWTYTGLDTTEMERRVTTYTEFSISNNVNGIKNIESTTLQGISVEKIYFQPDVNIDLAIAQVVSATNSIRAVLPPGINPPIVVRYSASAVPVIQLALSSDKQNEKQLYDYAQYRVRQALVVAPGATIPSPYGGEQRQIMVDLDTHALQGYGLTPVDVTAAVSAQNVTVPSGLVKFGTEQYVVRLNSTPEAVDALNNIPLRVVNGRTVLLRDVAWVRDGSQVQQNIVRSDGRRSVLLSILKNGNASTLSVVNQVKALLGGVQAAAPEGMHITPLFDQSVFVSGAMKDVAQEGVIAAGLTGLMILLFLGSWRSTLIVLISIPLSVMASLAALSALGETLNVMTLGGLALAVGILVDDATVAVENTYRLLDDGRTFRDAVVEGASGIAKPALVSTLAICAAFISVLFLTDAAKDIFTPQALAVVFAMLASYGLSRTLVPILVDVLVSGERHGEDKPAPSGVFGRFHAGFDRRFDRFREGYLALLGSIIGHRAWTLGAVALVLCGGGGLYFVVGRDYFPAIDAGQMQLHVRTRSGMRIEDAELVFQRVEDAIRKVIPARDLGLLLDNIGLPANNYNLAFSSGTTVAYNDGVVLVSLKAGHRPTADYMRVLRVQLNAQFPDTLFYFEPADIVTQVLNFGVPSAVAIQVAGKDAAKNRQVAQDLLAKVRNVRGIADAHIQQILDAPQFFVSVDRERAQELGLTMQQIASNVNVSLSSSYQVTPNFWADPATGIPYQVAVQTPEYRVADMDQLENTPLTDAGPGGVVPLRNVATLQRQGVQTVINHSNTQPTFDIYASVADRDLGSVAADLDDLVSDASKQLSPGNRIVVRGQIQSMRDAFIRIGLGLAAALAFVYLLMAVNFQSWGDPLVVLLALPIAFCGIMLSLFATGTTLSIPSMMGAIMAVGVASANSILLVTFAREHRERTGASAAEAAVEAGSARLRPVLMTAGAMFVGLIPMALNLGDGGEQNAALARAVLGGVGFGTCSTLLFVPFLYSVLRTRAARAPEDYA